MGRKFLTKKEFKEKILDNLSIERTKEFNKFAKKEFIKERKINKKLLKKLL